jgi:hypothetical protein
MMTPKEKAIELVDRYYSLFSIELENTIDISEAKQCALITVDEILDIIDNMNQYDHRLDYYWEQVKQELEKL